jgi:4-amino-4-deoxy-L-arabinose transferase-like glycosyltransferase
MSEMTLQQTSSTQTHPLSISRNLPFGLTLTAIALGGIILLAATLRLTNLEAIGSGNLYYTAAVKSMLQSWHNFFYVAAEPGGSVTVDKPPLGLWIQTAFAYFLGVSGVSVTLPQALAGILSVPVLYALVKRYAGELAGLLAALILAITPIAIAADRNNTMDSTLLLTLLLATWAFMKATDTGKSRWLMLGAVLIGVGFNIKMLQAFLPLPALYALYFFGAKVGWGRKMASLLAATVLMLAVSLSWAIIVDMTPTDQRPYIGSSTDNTVMELIVGHNGATRLFAGNRPQPPQGADGPQPGSPPAGVSLPPQGPDGAPGGAGQRPSQPGGPGGGPGSETGEPGVFRLFDVPLSNDIGWLLPLGLLSIALVGVSTAFQWPLTDQHKAVIVWGGWLLTTTIFFSVAGLFHSYYLSMMGPPLAALVAIALAGLWKLFDTRPGLAAILMILIAVGTVAFQMFIVFRFIGWAWWLLLIGLAAMGGIGLLLIGLGSTTRSLVNVSMALLLASILIAPALWSAFTMLDDTPNAALPDSYTGSPLVSQNSVNGAAARPGRSVNAALLEYLQKNTQGMEYLLAVPSSMQGASTVIETGRPVLYMGGFSGNDPVVDATDLAQMVSDGRLRFILWGGGRNGEGKAEIATWLKSTCVEVSGFSTSTDPLPPPPGGPQGGPPPEQASTLYDCGG